MERAKASAPIDAAVLLRGRLVSVVGLVAVITVAIEVHRLFGFGARRFREGLSRRNVGPFGAGAHAHLGHSRCGVLEILAELAHDGVLTAIHTAQRHRHVKAYLAKAEKETDEQLMQRRRRRMGMRADACCHPLSRPPPRNPFSTSKIARKELGKSNTGHEAQAFQALERCKHKGARTLTSMQARASNKHLP